LQGVRTGPGAVFSHSPPAGEACFFIGGAVAGEKLAAELFEAAGADCLPCAFDEPGEVAQVVVGCEAVPEQFVVPEEVVEVGEAELAAGEAIAGGVGRGVDLAVGGVADGEPACIREEGAVAAEPGGEDAIEHVDAAGDAFDEVFGAADAHEVARPVDGELGAGDFDGLPHAGFGFADGEAADGEAGWFGLDGFAGVVAAEGGVGPALDDGEGRQPGGGLAAAAVMVGPEVVPAEAFTEEAWAELMAV